MSQYCYANCYLYKKLKLFLLHQLKPKNNQVHICYSRLYLGIKTVKRCGVGGFHVLHMSVKLCARVAK